MSDVSHTKNTSISKSGVSSVYYNYIDNKNNVTRVHMYGKSYTQIVNETYRDPMLELPKVVVNGNGHPMSVGFNKKGADHLVQDAKEHSNALRLEHLPQMDKILADSKFVAKSALNKKRDDNIKRFYYYQTKIRSGKKKRRIFIHVAETDYYDSKGHLRHSRFVYSVTGSLQINKREQTQ